MEAIYYTPSFQQLAFVERVQFTSFSIIRADYKIYDSLSNEDLSLCHPPPNALYKEIRLMMTWASL